MKDLFIALAIVIVVLGIMAIIANWNKIFSSAPPAQQEGVFDVNGNPVNGSGLRAKCDPNCLVPYPEGSQWYGYFYCKGNCASFYRTTPIVPIVNPIVVDGRPTGGIGATVGTGTVGGFAGGRR